MDGYYFQQWGQIIDPNQSNSTTPHYEGWSFTVRNTDLSREKLDSADWFRHGFDGNIFLADYPASNHEMLGKLEQTKEMPWYAVEESSYIK